MEMMRRALSIVKMGRTGPVMVEIPMDLASEQINPGEHEYKPVKTTSSSGNPDDVDAAMRVLIEAKQPLLFAGQGILYAEASDELVELAELLQAPVMTTITGKSAFPEDHPLALGTGGVATTGPLVHYLPKADVILAVGTSLTRHTTMVNIPPGKIIIHA